MAAWASAPMFPSASADRVGSLASSDLRAAINAGTAATAPRPILPSASAAFAFKNPYESLLDSTN